MSNTEFQFPEGKTEKDFQKEIYIETDDPNRPILMRVDEGTWTFILKAKTSEKLEKVILSSNISGKMIVETKNILLEN